MILRALGLAALVPLAIAIVWLPADGFSASTVDTVTDPRVAAGRAAYLDSCSACHGIDAAGVAHRGPSLRGVGAMAADFYLTTGRMPLQDPGLQPLRSHPAFPADTIAAIVAYIGSLGGPSIPRVDPTAGSLSRGFTVFTDSCAGCHQIVARGGIVSGGLVPSLVNATPTQIAEAVRVGPYLMPKFNGTAINQQDLNSLVRYIQYAKSPKNAGGWSIGLIGPVPEGMVAWLVGLAALLVVARLIGTRAKV
jgi:ubiquinol-cytochrome c reductase cytochrome c subunit